MAPNAPHYILRSGMQYPSIGRMYKNLTDEKADFSLQDSAPDLPADVLLETDWQFTADDRVRMHSQDVSDPLSEALSVANEAMREEMIANEKAADRLGLRGVTWLDDMALTSLRAEKQLRSYGVRYTDLVDGSSLVDTDGATVSLKLENTQQQGSYKVRGALAAIGKLMPEQRERGVAAVSSGNHAAAVSYAAQLFGTRAVLVMPTRTPAAKQERVVNNNGLIELAGDDFDSSSQAFESYLQAHPHLTAIPPFDNKDVIAGQSTVGVEVLAQSHDVTHIFVPVGGGGLIGGIAQYVKAVRPRVKVIGVETQGQDALTQSLSGGKRVTLENLDAWCDGTAVRRVGELTFELAQKYVDDVITVTRRELGQAVIDLHQEGHQVEPAGALALAGIRSHNRRTKESGTYVAICSGGNIDDSKLHQAAKYSSSTHYPASSSDRSKIAVG
jgi:threonine dehydratase